MPTQYDHLFDSEAAWPGFKAMDNYLPKIDINALKIALLFRAHIPDCTYLEVGSFVGTTALVAAGEGYKKIYCVDTWSGGSDPNDRINNIYKEHDTDVFYTFADNVKGYKITPVRKESLLASRCFGDQTIDVVFLDGDHTYEAVKNDIMAWLPKVKPGGVLCGHDFGFFEGVEKAVREMFPDKPVSVIGTVWMVFV